MAKEAKPKDGEGAPKRPPRQLGKMVTPLAIGLVLGGSGLLTWTWLQPEPTQVHAAIPGVPLRLGTHPIPSRVLTSLAIIRGGYDPVPALEAQQVAGLEPQTHTSIERHPLQKLAILSQELPILHRELSAYLSDRQKIVLEYTIEVTSRWMGRQGLSPQAFLRELDRELQVVRRFNYDQALREEPALPEHFENGLATMRAYDADDYPGLTRLAKALTKLDRIEGHFQASAPDLPGANSLHPAQAAQALLDLIEELLIQVQVEWNYRPDPLDLPEAPNLHDIIARQASRLTIRSNPRIPPDPVPIDDIAQSWSDAIAQYDENQRLLDPTYRAARDARVQRERSERARATAEDLRRIRSWAR